MDDLPLLPLPNLIWLAFQRNITNLQMFSVRLKQTHFPHTVPMISKLTSKKALNCPSVGCTHYPKLRFKHYASSLMRTSALASFVLPSRLTVCLFSLLRRKTALSA